MTLNVSYQAQKDNPVYVGITLVREGIALAEITTNPSKPLFGKGKVSSSLDTAILNPGAYHFDVGLFRSKNRQLIAIPKNKNQFILKGHDPTKGGAIKLADTWKYS